MLKFDVSQNAISAPTAIRRGRYTLEKRTRNIERVKLLEREERARRLRSLDPQRRQGELQRLAQRVTAADRAHNLLTPEFFDKVPLLEALYMVRHLRCFHKSTRSSLFVVLFVFGSADRHAHRGVAFFKL